ncbi:MAG: hypothetical protein D6796_05270, partial [Caldilineae bacterium]
MKPKPNLVALLLYLLLTPFLTWPLPLRLANAVPGDIGDPLLNTWILAWDAHALLDGPRPLFQANIFFPLPNTLAFSEHLLSTATLALPLQPLTAEPLLAYNLSLLATFPLAAFGMYLLARRQTGRRGAAFVAGLVFAFAPYRLAAISHLQLLTLHWLPYSLLFLREILAADAPSRRRWRHAAGLAITLTAQLLASWYLAVYTAMAIAVWLAFVLPLRRPPRQALLPAAAALLATGLLVAPAARPYFALAGDLRQSRPLSWALPLAAAPTDYVAAAPANRLFGPLTASFRARPGFTEEHTLFVGLVAPLLALVAAGSVLRRAAPRRRAEILALAALLLLAVALTFPAPYAALAALFPPSTL